MILFSTAPRRLTVSRERQRGNIAPVLLGVIASAYRKRRLGDSATYRAAVIADSPAGYWRLAETTGNTANNEIGGQPNGTYTANFTLGGSTLLSGISSLQLTGSGYVQLSSGYSFTSNFTIEALVRRAGTNAAHGTVMMRRFNAYMFAAQDSQLILNKDQSAVVGTANVTLNDDWPHHVAVTVTSGNVWTLWHNGANMASGSTTAFGAGTTPFFIGTDFSSVFADQFIGGLGEVAIYSTALSSGQILAHAQAAGQA